jgi:hypothetical protein
MSALQRALIALAVTIGLADKALAQTASCIPVPISQPASGGQNLSFDAGVNFDGQRTYLVHGYVQPANNEGIQCFNVTGLDIHPVTSVQVVMGISSVLFRSNGQASVAVTRTEFPSDEPTVYFRVTGSRSIKQLSFIIMMAGGKSEPTLKELDDKIASLRNDLNTLRDRTVADLRTEFNRLRDDTVAGLRTDLATLRDRTVADLRTDLTTLKDQTVKDLRRDLDALTALTANTPFVCADRFWLTGGPQGLGTSFPGPKTIDISGCRFSKQPVVAASVVATNANDVLSVTAARSINSQKAIVDVARDPPDSGGWTSPSWIDWTAIGVR